MMILRDKLLAEANEIIDASKCSSFTEGYMVALHNIANDIDANMIPLESEAMINFHIETIKHGLLGEGNDTWEEEIDKSLCRITAERRYSILFETPDPSPHDHKSKP